jgi:hypothetical protein
MSIIRFLMTVFSFHEVNQSVSTFVSEAEYPHRTYCLLRKPHVLHREFRTSFKLDPTLFSQFSNPRMRHSLLRLRYLVRIRLSMRTCCSLV